MLLEGEKNHCTLQSSWSKIGLAIVLLKFSQADVKTNSTFRLYCDCGFIELVFEKKKKILVK